MKLKSLWCKVGFFAVTMFAVVVRSKSTERSLGASIRRAREDAGLTQAQLASALGVSQNIIGRLESGGRADPRLSTLIRLREVLKVSLDDLAVSAGLSKAQPSGRATDRRIAQTLGKLRQSRKSASELVSALKELEDVMTAKVPTKQR